MLWVCSCEIYRLIFPKVLSEVFSLRPNLVNQWVSWSFLQECCIVESPCKQGNSSWLEPWSSAQLTSKSAGWKVFSSVSLSTMSPWRGGSWESGARDFQVVYFLSLKAPFQDGMLSIQYLPFSVSVFLGDGLLWTAVLWLPQCQASAWVCPLLGTFKRLESRATSTSTL